MHTTLKNHDGKRMEGVAAFPRAFREGRDDLRPLLERNKMRSVNLFVASVASASLLISGGCGNPVSAVAIDHESVSIDTKPPIIDAGVVLADRPFYLCIPLTKVGLRSDEEIISLHSSCDCVRVQIVKFCESGRQATSFAFLLESVSDADVGSPGSEPDFSPTHLRIEVGVELSDGRTHRFFVEFVESALAVHRRATNSVSQSLALASG